MGAERFVAAEPAARGGSEAGAAAAECVLCTRDEALADHVALIAAAAGVGLRLARPGDPVPGPEPPVLLVGPDALGGGAAPRGGSVVLVGYPDRAGDLWQAAAGRPGARVAVLPEAAAWLGEFLGELGLRSGTGRVLVAAGWCGGAGTTTVAALAAAAATLEGRRALVVDADPCSPGLWPVLQGRAPDGVGWEDLAGSSGRVAPAQLAEVLPLARGTSVLTWRSRSAGDAVPAGVLAEVLAAARRVFDLVVVDAGRSALVGPALAEAADAGLAVLRAEAPPGPWAGDRFAGWRGAVCGRLPAGADAAGVAGSAGLEPAGYLPPERAVARASLEGRLPSALGSRRVRRRLSALLAGALPAAGGAR